MCDPVTLSIGAGAASSYGTVAYLGGATAGNLMTAASIGLTVAGTGLSMASQEQARKLQEAKFEMQERRYRSEIQEERISALQQANNRKKDYMRKMSTFYANTAGRGITQFSPSSRSILQSNEDILRQDLNAISLSSFEKEMYFKGMRDEASLAKQAQSSVGTIATGLTGLSKASNLTSELSKPAEKLNFNSVSNSDPFAGRYPGGFKRS